ncbi:MAG: UMP kinase [Thermoprotei archaeon]|nr:MAG: UMP kinase [Thermoprotei archaeon]RLF23640.1 MAG: UMP kinase [Thermoprotei archaeon]
MRLVLKIGGHVLFRDNMSPNVELLDSYANLVRELKEKSIDIHVVVGGGTPARAYIEAAKTPSATQAELDHIGILVSQLNAYLLAIRLKPIAHLPIPTSFRELSQALNTGKVIVCGGLVPGQSTMAVAALIAELVKADYLINATDVDGVYTDDPKRNPNARLIEVISVDKLRQLLRTKSYAGTYPLFDEVSLGIIERSRIKTVVLNGMEVDNIKKLVLGEHVGTLILAET